MPPLKLKRAGPQLGKKLYVFFCLCTVLAGSLAPFCTISQMSWQVDWKSQTLALVGGLLHFPGWCSGCLVSEASWETIHKVVVRSGSHEPGFHGSVGDWLLPLLSQLDLLLELQRASACLWWVSSKVWTASTFVIYDFSSSWDVFFDEKECWV